MLDSQWKDQAAKNKTSILLDLGHKVFIWPKKLGTKYKDFNDIAMGLKTNQIPTTFIDEHSHSGLKGKVLMSQIN